ncbi:MAG: AMP-binding protein, partial [Gammaproteobacteria bacterium]
MKHLENSHFPAVNKKTIPSWAVYWSLRQPDAMAILSPDGRSVTYAQLCEQIAQIVLRLKSAHLKRNDRVALVLPNGLDLAVAILGTASYATAVPVNPSLQSNELRSYLEMTKTKSVLLADQGMEEVRKVAAEAGLRAISMDMNRDSEVSPRKIIEPLEFSSLAKFVKPNDTAFVLPTSGTTSTPKAVSISQSSACADAFDICRWLKLNEKDRCLGIMPLFHVHALFAGLLASLISGGSFVSTPGYLSDKFFSWLKELKPTWYSAAPTIHQAIVDDASLVLNQNISDHSRLRFIRSAAAPLSPELLKKIEDLFKAPLIETYGMTELRTFIAANPLPPQQRKPGSVGLEVGLPVAIIDSSGERVPVGEPGEIVVSENHEGRKYIQDQGHRSSEIEDGWFRTGDIGTFDDEGYLFISGRSKEIIIRGGLNLSPVEIEQVLARHNEIGEV